MATQEIQQGKRGKAKLAIETAALDKDVGQPFRLADHQHVAGVDLD
jgi:hypothetical protein